MPSPVLASGRVGHRDVLSDVRSCEASIEFIADTARAGSDDSTAGVLGAGDRFVGGWVGAGFDGARGVSAGVGVSCGGVHRG